MQSVACCFKNIFHEHDCEIPCEKQLCTNLIESFERFFPSWTDLIDVIKEYHEALNVWSGSHLTGKPNFTKVFYTEKFLTSIQSDCHCISFSPYLKTNGLYGCPPEYTQANRMFFAIVSFERFFKDFQIRIGADAFQILIEMVHAK